MQHVLTDSALHTSPVFVVMAGTRVCAFPLHYVAETMRPLPIQPVAGTPDCVRGVSVIRGTPTPVVDLKALLDNGENCPSYGRFVTLKPVHPQNMALSWVSLWRRSGGSLISRFKPVWRALKEENLF